MKKFNMLLKQIRMGVTIVTVSCIFFISCDVPDQDNPVLQPKTESSASLAATIRAANSL